MTFIWSKGRQLDSYTNKDGEKVSYTYDTDGMRLSKTVDGVKHTYLYENGLLVQETRGDKIFDYSYDANGSIRMLKYRANASATPSYFYYALNTRGDVIGLYTSQGTLSVKYAYDPWGNTVSITDGSGNNISNTTGLAVIQPFRYRSYYYDMDSGFYYLQSRYYDPVTHRFINADGLIKSIGIIQNYNLYVYCKNNPAKYADYNGLDAVIAYDADVPGHIGLLIEDADGNWGHFYWGASDLSMQGLAPCVLGIDVEANAWFSNYSGDISLDSINNANQFSGDYESIIELKGDFSESYAAALKCDELNTYNSKSYNLYTNNCSTVSFSILSESNHTSSSLFSAASKHALPSFGYNQFKIQTKINQIATKVKNTVTNAINSLSKFFSKFL